MRARKAWAGVFVLSARWGRTEFGSGVFRSMMTLGILLLIIGFVTGITVVRSIGVIVFVIGLILWILGSLGHAVGGRRHYF